jgi:hypothetical protein
VDFFAVVELGLAVDFYFHKAFLVLVDRRATEVPEEGKRVSPFEFGACIEPGVLMGEPRF